MAVVSTVRIWHGEDGWGVLASAETLGSSLRIRRT
jgi:hypothetical protein